MVYALLTEHMTSEERDTFDFELEAEPVARAAADQAAVLDMFGAFS